MMEVATGVDTMAAMVVAVMVAMVGGGDSGGGVAMLVTMVPAR